MELKKVPCQGCGRMIVWAVSPDGTTRIPLDPTPPVYLLTNRELGGRLIAERSMIHMVNHFVTCPNRDHFKRAR